MRNFRKLTCAFLAVVMVLSIMPISALAETEEVPPCAEDSHIWDDGVRTEATEDASAFLTYTCTLCGQTKKETIEEEPPVEPEEKLPCEHSWDDGFSSETVIMYTCTLCGETKTEELTAVEEPTPCADDAHIWDKGVGPENVITYTCTLCGKTKEESVSLITAGEAIFEDTADLVDGVVIDQTNFPDYNFWCEIASEKYDANQDGILSEEEIANITSMDVSGMWIYSLQGIEYFSNLESLNCSDNKLTNLDISNFQKLTTIFCEDNSYSITVGADYTFDLSALPGFDVNRASNWVGGTVQGSTLTATDNMVTYDYDLDGTSGSCIGHFTLEVVQNADSQFSTFEELKALTAKDYLSDVSLRCIASKLTIEESMTIPEHCRLFVENIVIPEGVTLTVNGDIYCTNLSVEGTLKTASSGYCDIFADPEVFAGTVEPYMASSFTGTISVSPAGTLDVTSAYMKCGTLNVDGRMELLECIVHVYRAITLNGSIYSELLNPEGEIQIDGNVDMKQFNFEKLENTILQIRYEEAGAEDFFAAVDRANHDANVKNPVKHWVDLKRDAAVEISKNLTIPHNCFISANSSSVGSGAIISVPTNVTLTLEEASLASCKLDVSGTVVNRGSLALGGNSSVSGTIINDGQLGVMGYILTLQPGAQYSGTGTITVGKSNWTPNTGDRLDPFDALPGLSREGFIVTEGHDWILTPSKGLPQLGTPVDLRWNYAVQRKLNDNGEWVSELAEKPGSIAWKITEPCQNDFKIAVFDTDGIVHKTYHPYVSSSQTLDYYSVDFVIASDLPSGDYYFTVQSIGDGTAYANSEIAKSDVWTYVQPETQLGECTDLVQNGKNFTFQLPDQMDMVGGWEMKLYLSRVESHEGEWAGIRQFTDVVDRTVSGQIDNEYLLMYGPGYYSVKVRALSKDITKIANGPWTEVSKAYNLPQAHDDIETLLDDLVNYTDKKDADAIRDFIQSMDTEKLTDAMLADQGGSVLEDLETLEKNLGLQPKISIDSEIASIFKQSEVSIIGAGLNSPNDTGRSITLELIQPERDHVIEEQYNNALAIRFAMKLDNVVSNQNLSVPVMVKLPVPDTINPQSIVLLHYDANGDFEEIRPVLKKEGNRWYASFLLTHFSDFIMTEMLKTGECQHEWAEGVVTLEPTCKKAGEKVYTCAICGKSETRQLPALGHDWSEWTVTKGPSCGKKGVETRTCKRCGKTETRKIAALEHEWSKWSVTKEPTCTQDGCESRTCKHCGKTETRKLAALGHDWGHWVSVSSTKYERTCKHCGAKETRRTFLGASPNTGDFSHIGLWSATMLFSITACVILFVFQEKKKKS